MMGEKQGGEFRREKFQNWEVKYFFVLYCVGKGRKVPETLCRMKKPGHICREISTIGRFDQQDALKTTYICSGKRKEAKENLERKKYNSFFLLDIKKKKNNLN